MTLTELERLAGVQLFDYQIDAFVMGEAQRGPQQRLCLYYKTGAGKSLTALGLIALWGHSRVLVVAPPATHNQWMDLGHRLNMDISVISHAKFRMKDTKIERDVPIVADEFHLFGGHNGKGWQKLERVAKGLQAPMVLASATPNYNDAERVYCIQRIIDPTSTIGGYLEFLYQNCRTEQNPFSVTPTVTGFLHYPDAAAYLAAMDRVAYLPDDTVYNIQEHTIDLILPDNFKTFGYDARTQRIIASQIEERHRLVDYAYLLNDVTLRTTVRRQLQSIIKHINPTRGVMVFAVHKEVARAAAVAIESMDCSVYVINGDTPKQVKLDRIEDFKRGAFGVLVGTATLATGTDGLDKRCDTLIILDDTDDDALRRQLIGRIMPRGADTDASMKRVHRFTPEFAPMP